VQLVLPSDLPLSQRITLDTRVGEERGTEGAGTKACYAAPGAAQVRRIEYGVREYDRGIAAIEEDLTHQNARATAVREDEALVAIGTAQALEHDFDAHAWTSFRDAGGERAAVGQPRPISACGSGRTLPVSVAGDRIHR
jgi:hypothetical protein